MLPLTATTPFNLFSVEFAGPEIVSAGQRNVGDDFRGNGSVCSSQKPGITLLLQQLKNFLNSF